MAHLLCLSHLSSAQVSPPNAAKLSLSPYLSIVLGVTLSIVFCLAAGLCRRYSQLTTPQVLLRYSAALYSWQLQTPVSCDMNSCRCPLFIMSALHAEQLGSALREMCKVSNTRRMYVTCSRRSNPPQLRCPPQALTLPSCRPSPHTCTRHPPHMIWSRELPLSKGNALCITSGQYFVQCRFSCCNHVSNEASPCTFPYC